MKHDQAQFQDLPAPLPEGERIVWRGRPSFIGLAWRAFHIREVAIYFGLLMAWRLASNVYGGVSAGDAAASVMTLVVPATSAVAVLGLLAWLFKRASCYTITTKRVVLQFGVALPTTMNIPLSKVANAALKTYRDGSGDIPLRLTDSKRVSFLLLWPHVRPWRLRIAEPMLRAVPDAANVAARLAEVLSGQPSPSAISVAQFGKSDSASVTNSKRTTSVAA